MVAIPLHQSLTHRFTMWGLPRTLGISLWTTILAMALGMQQLWVVPVGVLFHLLLLRISKKDPYMLEVFLNLLQQDERLNP